jgi:hypothetical protein
LRVSVAALVILGIVLMATACSLFRDDEEEIIELTFDRMLVTLEVNDMAG